ncbi:MAG: 50S ribosomal protein L31 [Candidatus Yanofskybacteria bacterium RIFCSPLOWO2_01_FULL_49_17]|uniref:Large ribosomal subunit protein bL31 n=1 Tax=Candidatus Yanofskybacteria bacterium RIFCSPLOWO2_01_FULL_49_17 TaxID=1802700 RepID=A0A1F8GQJ1_9BACT|nr:MAG: 50S ribosomal protein L31 [Candidatus Yanofskybacteria bacterium RIFCSPLOWO2_01_FULL_49_17]
MKQGIHPTYHPNAKIKCVCGNEWTVGSTMPEIHTSICSKCHPFYTGTEKIVDTRGRVDRFKRQLEKTASAKKSVIPKKVRAKAKK